MAIVEMAIIYVVISYSSKTLQGKDMQTDVEREAYRSSTSCVVSHSKLMVKKGFETKSL